ncbi:MAG: flavin reductase [Deltaproteobacteria bacterium]|nr:flavin reductase [Deltaproteobacteria bacterium]
MPIFHAWDERWFLLTAGTLAPGGFNTMTVGWGAFGMMWNRPFALVVVRPTRHTFGFVDRSPDFTLSLFPEAFQDKLELCGTVSGQDVDKIAVSGLTPVPSLEVASPSFAEAELVLECRKTYWHDLDPTHFLDPRIHGLYEGDHHRAWFGDVLAVEGTRDWERH